MGNAKCLPLEAGPYSLLRLEKGQSFHREEQFTCQLGQAGRSTHQGQCRKGQGHSRERDGDLKPSSSITLSAPLARDASFPDPHRKQRKRQEVRSFLLPS